MHKMFVIKMFLHRMRGHLKFIPLEHVNRNELMLKSIWNCTRESREALEKSKIVSRTKRRCKFIQAMKSSASSHGSRLLTFREPHR